jgi:hypothetical protein
MLVDRERRSSASCSPCSINSHLSNVGVVALANDVVQVSKGTRATSRVFERTMNTSTDASRRNGEASKPMTIDVYGRPTHRAEQCHALSSGHGLFTRASVLSSIVRLIFSTFLLICAERQGTTLSRPLVRSFVRAEHVAGRTRRSGHGPGQQPCASPYRQKTERARLATSLMDVVIRQIVGNEARGVFTCRVLVSIFLHRKEHRLEK